MSTHHLQVLLAPTRRPLGNNTDVSSCHPMPRLQASWRIRGAWSDLPGDLFNTIGKVPVIPRVSALVPRPIIIIREDEDGRRGLLLRPVDELLSTLNPAVLCRGRQQ
ncbi:Uncharacterized protein FKW44_020864 [Caligus rogercresseyi]|uniref:Uncharacterized protein n=1 Tax=Caligus rogercresseyi TaxID=217165 RepID=A0A7T8GQJ9_CALRO|nr:Uncharacterized protein FKW44_020864 [Caligus rogercresseyi]